MLTSFVWLISRRGFPKFGLIEFSNPGTLYNSSNVGLYQIGIQNKNDPLNAQFSRDYLESNICTD